MTQVRAFEVGGSIRDSFLGIRSSDIDFTVEVDSFDALREYVISIGGDIKVETPEYVTIKAVVDGRGMDFVICRKDGVYSDGRHPDGVNIGTIEEDLARRDFTINAIAKNVDTGEILDPYDGRGDIERRRITCVGNTFDRINEDPIRLIRAIRFSITKECAIDQEILDMITPEWITRIRETVSEERIREEIFKMFQYDTYGALVFVMKYPCLVELFSGHIWLNATVKSR